MRIPRAVKIGYAVWMAVWVPVYWVHNGPANFLWLCDTANFVIGLGLWIESPLLISSQAVAVLLIQLYWALDFFSRLLFGSHLLGGTEYMFDAGQALWLRGFSLFHLAVPPLVLWVVWRLGYDRRGWRLQTLITWLILPLSMLPDPERNLNWVWAPFGAEQVWLPPALYLAVCMIAYPLLLYLPTHGLLMTWQRGAGRRVLPEEGREATSGG